MSRICHTHMSRTCHIHMSRICELSYTYVTHVSHTYVTNMWVVVHIFYAHDIHICHEYVSCRTHMSRTCHSHMSRICELSYTYVTHMRLSCRTYMSRLCDTHMNSYEMYSETWVTIRDTLVKFEARVMTHICHEYVTNMSRTDVISQWITYRSQSIYVTTMCHWNSYEMYSETWVTSHDTHMSRICREYVMNMSRICYGMSRT